MYKTDNVETSKTCLLPWDRN